MNLKPYEVKLIAELLEIAADKFANHGCNDFSLKELSKEEQIELLQDFHKYNGDPEEFDENNTEWFHDSALMSYFADKIKSNLQDR